jgi:hypothetical protein
MQHFGLAFALAWVVRLEVRPARSRSLDFRTYPSLSRKLPGGFAMKITVETAGIDPDLKAEMQAACDRIARGILPTIDERKAAATIDRRRDENARLFGIQDVTLGAVRQSSDSP